MLKKAKIALQSWSTCYHVSGGKNNMIHNVNGCKIRSLSILSQSSVGVCHINSLVNCLVQVTDIDTLLTKWPISIHFWQQRIDIDSMPVLMHTCTCRFFMQRSGTQPITVHSMSWSAPLRASRVRPETSHIHACQLCDRQDTRRPLHCPEKQIRLPNMVLEMNSLHNVCFTNLGGDVAIS